MSTARALYLRASRPRVLPAFEKTVLFYTGLVAPNVFNRADLSVSDVWAVIERYSGEKWELIPFDDLAGERLDYHRSDLLYYKSLAWRRGMIGVTDLGAYHRPGREGYEYARRMALYDHSRYGGSGIYRVTLYRNHASGYAYGTASVRYEPVRMLEFTLQIGTEKP